MNCEPGDSGDISVQLLNERNCDALNSVTGQAASNDFTFDYDDVPDGKAETRQSCSHFRMLLTIL